MSNPTNHCPACGEGIPDGAPQGLCPKCLLAGVGQTQKLDNGSPEGHRAPSIEEVAAAFPNLQVLGLVGQGGMGCVFKARQPKLDRFVALKLLPTKFALDAAFRERFSREARVLARLNHPNIVSVFDFGEAGGFFYLLMEFVDGANLRQAMQAGRFTPDQALAIVPKICEALQFAHTEGILHRDIKPENILLDTKGRVKIADFGIAKLVGEPSPVTRLTATGAAVGTPQYMAPEQLERPQEVDHRADIYSLGVVFYEMLTGELPLGRFAPPSQKTPMDPRVDEVVLRALEKEREKRYQSAGEVKTSVEHLTGTPGQAGTVRASLTPEEDFVLCNPRLPRMARAISVYAMIVCPVLWLVGVLVMKQEHHTNLYAEFVQQMTDGLTHLGEFIGVILFVIGGLKLRRLKPSGPRWIATAVWMHIAVVVIALLGTIWVEQLHRNAPEDAEAAVPMGEAILGVLSLGALVFGIWSLVWLRRNARLLKEIFAAAVPAGAPERPPAERAARRATIAAILTVISLVLGMPFLAGSVFMAMVLRQMLPNGSFGPVEIALMVTNLLVVMAVGLGGFLPGLSALNEIRSIGGLARGRKRALCATLAWPTLLLVVTVALTISACLGGFLPNGRGFIWKLGATTAFALGAGVLAVFATWRWALAVPRGQRTPGAWAASCIAAALLLVPSLLTSLWSGMMTVLRTPTASGLPTHASLLLYPGESPVTELSRAFNGLLQVPAGHVLLLKAHLWSNGIAIPANNLTAHVVAPRQRQHRDLLSWRILSVGEPGNRGAGWNISVGGGSNPVLYPPAQGAERPDWKLTDLEDVVLVAPGETRTVRMLRGSGLASDGTSVEWEATLDLQLIKPEPDEESQTKESVVAPGTNWRPRVTIIAGAPERSVTVEAAAPPRETFVVTGIVLSNGVPVSGSELRAKLWPPSPRDRSPYVIRWQAVEGASGDSAPWEIVVEDKTSNTIAARLRPAKLPRLNWTVSPAAKNVGKRDVKREAFAFEVGRALQTTGEDNALAALLVADWSVRIQFQSSPLQPTASKRGMDVDFVLPANQVATFEVVTRSNGVIVPLPELSAHQINGTPESYTGKFVLADDPDDLDSLTGLPRWRFGIIGPDGRLLETGQGIRPIPSDFNLSMEMWKALEPDKEVIEGMTESASPGPKYGLRIRTQAFKPKPGLRHTSSGFGTNWMKDAAQHLAPSQR